jgi:hypothetical protein
LSDRQKLELRLHIHILHLALAIRNRGYTNKVRLRGLMQNQGFQPAQTGFACVAVTSSRLVQDMSRQKSPRRLSTRYYNELVASPRERYDELRITNYLTPKASRFKT